MPDEPTSTPVVTDEGAAEPRSDNASEQPAQSGWHNLFGLLPGKAPTTATADEGASEEAARPPLSSKKLGELSDAELDELVRTDQRMQRRVQAETDRRESRRFTDNAAKAKLEREAAVQRKLDPNSPDYDPYAGTEEQAKLKAEEATTEQFTSLLGDIGKQHDTATLDVLVAALPAAEKERIFKLEGAGVGLDGRRLIVSEGLKSLEKHWRAQGAKDAEQKLRGNPVFRKQVFAEHRDQVDEPELVEATGATRTGDTFMNMIQDDYHAAKGRRR